MPKLIIHIKHINKNPAADLNFPEWIISIIIAKPMLTRKNTVQWENQIKTAPITPLDMIDFKDLKSGVLKYK